MNNTQVDYRNGPLFPMILRFSIPAAVSLLITAVYNIVDRMFVGNFNGTSALAGLSVCFPLSYMMMAFGLMCSAGGSTCFSLFSGQAVTNILLDALFIIVFDWGVAGAAAATVTGQILSALFGAFLVLGGHSQVRVSRDIFRPRKRLSANILSCGFAFWVAQMAMGFISLVHNSQLGRYGGDIAISVYAVISSIMTFVIMPASGISQGIQPILGNNYGSGNYKRVMQTFRLATALSVGVTCVIWLAVLVFPRQILAAFGGTQEMFDIGVTGLRINFCITPVLGFVMLATTFFQSINRPVPSVLISLLRQVVFLVPFLYLLPLVWQINGIFFAQPISDLLTTVLSVVLVWQEQRRMYAKLPAWITTKTPRTWVVRGVLLSYQVFCAASMAESSGITVRRMVR